MFHRQHFTQIRIFYLCSKKSKNHKNKQGTVVQATATKITDKEVYLFGREKPIEFEYLVIATGSSYAFPAKVALPDLVNVGPKYEEINNAIKDANHITIVGGFYLLYLFCFLFYLLFFSVFLNFRSSICILCLEFSKKNNACIIYIV